MLALLSVKKNNHNRLKYHCLSDAFEVAVAERTDLDQRAIRGDLI